MVVRSDTSGSAMQMSSSRRGGSNTKGFGSVSSLQPLEWPVLKFLIPSSFLLHPLRTRMLTPVNIVLLEPEIPPNTGNIARMCAGTCSRLHLIEPLGFDLSDKRMKRAGMDYWKHVDWTVHASWLAFEESEPDARLWFVEQGGTQRYDEVKYEKDDYLIFGRETAGLPEALLERHREQWLRIPMFHAEARSFNLANCVSLVLFEALRQSGFDGEVFPS